MDRRRAALGRGTMNRDVPLPRLAAARRLTETTGEALRRSIAFRQLPVAKQQAILADVRSVERGLTGAPAGPRETPLAQPFVRRSLFPEEQQPQGDGGPAQPNAAPQPRAAATETLAARAGALSDEINFPAFVAGLVHGTFDAMVDASIRQMEAYAELVATVARKADDFTRDNVSRGQAIDWLSEKYPRDLERVVPLDGSGEPSLRVRRTGAEEEDAQDDRQPAWLADFDLEGEPLSDEVIELQLIPGARRRIGESRMQTLATMVLLGMNRIVVRDGSIAAKVRFRAAAKDRAKVAYASGVDPANGSWGERGSLTYGAPSMMVSTVGVNVQAESDLKVELFGEVKINFASETLPLDRFADSAQVALLQSHANRSSAAANGNDRGAGNPTTVPAPAPPSDVAPPPAAAPGGSV
ncbi:MAG: hypothetical protein ACT4R6_07760 [Gemmatimonadaceae bacterium]